MVSIFPAAVERRDLGHGSAVIGFVGTVIYSVALLFLNHVYLPPRLPAAARPGKRGFACLIVACLAYFALAAIYLSIVLEIL